MAVQIDSTVGFHVLKMLSVWPDDAQTILFMLTAL